MSNLLSPAGYADFDTVTGAPGLAAGQVVPGQLYSDYVAYMKNSVNINQLAPGSVAQPSGKVVIPGVVAPGVVSAGINVTGINQSMDGLTSSISGSIDTIKKSPSLVFAGVLILGLIAVLRRF